MTSKQNNEFVHLLALMLADALARAHSGLPIGNAYPKEVDDMQAALIDVGEQLDHMGDNTAAALVRAHMAELALARIRVYLDQKVEDEEITERELDMIKHLREITKSAI